MEVAAMADKLLKLSPSVRYVTVCDMNGKVTYSAHRKAVHTALSRKESLDSLKTAARNWRTRRAVSRKIGKCKSVVAEYDKVKRITMPAGRNHLLYVTTSASADANKVIRKIRSFR